MNETDHLLLYESCKGNPLEAFNILQKFKDDNNNFDFREFLPIYFTEACKQIEDSNELFLKEMRLKEIKNEKSLPFNEAFQYTLLHLDAETNIEKTNVGPEILNAMNRQYMVINKETRSLESLFPAAAYAMSRLRKVDFVEKDIKRILTNPEHYTKDTIGRLLERYILIQLEKEINTGREFKIRYFDDKKFQGKFTLHYMRVVRIRLGEIVPEAAYGNILFIPNDPTYPDVDLLYYDQKEHLLYPMQITVSLPKHKPSHEDFKTNFFCQWQTKLNKDRVDNKKLRMQWIWIGGPWDTESLLSKTDPLPIESQTAGSWTIDYKQLPYDLFDLSVNFHQITKVQNNPQLHPKTFQVEAFQKFINVKENTTPQTFKKRIEEGFPEQILHLTSNMEIHYFKEEVLNMYSLKISFYSKHLLERHTQQFFTLVIRVMSKTF